MLRYRKEVGHMMLTNARELHAMLLGYRHGAPTVGDFDSGSEYLVDAGPMAARMYREVEGWAGEAEGVAVDEIQATLATLASIAACAEVLFDNGSRQQEEEDKTPVEGCRAAMARMIEALWHRTLRLTQEDFTSVPGTPDRDTTPEAADAA